MAMSVPVVEEILTALRQISEAANELRQMRDVHAASALANPTAAAVRNLAEMQEALRRGYSALVAEPAIARVDAVLNGERRSIYVCRGTTVQGQGLTMASYRSPIGRLAALDIGESVQLPNDRMAELLTKARLRPIKTKGCWDSRRTVYETKAIGPLTIDSLLDLLRDLAESCETTDLVGALLAEDAARANVIDGVRRDVITAMSLRDQPILDRYQDEIFRLPLDRRLFLTGPAGTGKTTTLIRRLGQKLDVEFLDPEERRIVEAARNIAGVDHARSWLMFTPTELLRQYVKEAFAREGVPASNTHITTWDEHRHALARSTFPILRTAAGRGTMIYRDEVSILNDAAIRQSDAWFDDFVDWQDREFVLDLKTAAGTLAASTNQSARTLGTQLLPILEKADTTETIFRSISQLAEGTRSLVRSLQDSTTARIRAPLNLQLNRSPTFIDELRDFIDTLVRTDSGRESETDFDDDAEDEETDPNKTGRAGAINAFMRAVRAQARATALGNSVKPSSRNGQVLAWLGDRSLSTSDLHAIGTTLLTLDSARFFVSPLHRFIATASRRYRAFRRQRQAEGKWYGTSPIRPQDITPLELDGLLLLLLRTAAALLTRPDVRNDLENPVWSPMSAVLGRYHNQILVDEATDFSSVQLACMFSLTQRRIRSFFACGDLNQRLTTWGVQSLDKIKWATGDLDVRTVDVVYRQSTRLREFAHALGGHVAVGTSPAHEAFDGVPPALLENSSQSLAIEWLANRIREVEHFLHKLPSIAIFVNAESEVAPAAAALDTALAEANIRVTACHEGQAVGTDTNVRVFDIQHIKGLEFEAAFFLDVDGLVTQHPELYDKYIYVGATRAATYLGVVCGGALPARIEPLRNHFVADWSATQILRA